MKRQRKDASETRLRLLTAAIEVFAEKGFWEATHVEICERAKVNTAAVNYHFGSKENLYVEAWKHAFERSMEVYPPDGGVAPDAPVEQRLQGRILAMMNRIADPANHEIEIIHKEMANPTGLLTDTIRQTIDQMRQASLTIIRELLGAEADEEQVNYCDMSIMGQCFGPMLRLRRARIAPEEATPGPLPLNIDVEAFADHVLRFSLTGIRGIQAAGTKEQKE